MPTYLYSALADADPSDTNIADTPPEPAALETATVARTNVKTSADATTEGPATVTVDPVSAIGQIPVRLVAYPLGALIAAVAATRKVGAEPTTGKLVPYSLYEGEIRVGAVPGRLGVVVGPAVDRVHVPSLQGEFDNAVKYLALTYTDAGDADTTVPATDVTDIANRRVPGRPVSVAPTADRTEPVDTDT